MLHDINKQLEGHTPTWCPGCGNWGIAACIKSALTQLNINPSEFGIVFDIGCSGNMNDFLNGYAIHSLHGRAIANAVGMKLANHKLPVMVVGGDGGLYGEGGNHFLHACRGNHDITVIVHDNSVYGLTTGQVAPTAQKGFKSKSTPDGIIEVPVNPLALAITSGATFVAQGFAGDVGQAIDLIKQGIAHKGFSLVNILQPCVTFNKVNTYQYYLQKIYKVDPSYKANDVSTAINTALEMTIASAGNERFPLGIIYKDNRPSYHEQLFQLKDDVPLVQKQRNNSFRLLLEDFL